LVVVLKPTLAVWPALNVAPGAAVLPPALAALGVGAALLVAAAAALLVAVDAGAADPADDDADCVPPPPLELEPHAAAPNASAVATRAERPTRLPLD
jgi:hypothetical protein